MKSPVKTEHDSNGNGPRAAIEALCTIVETALSYRNEGRPNLATVAKLANRGSGLLKLSAIVSMNTVAEYVALDRLGYEDLERARLDKQTEEVRKGEMSHILLK
jgi:hypothetical protein